MNNRLHKKYPVALTGAMISTLLLFAAFVFYWHMPALNSNQTISMMMIKKISIDEENTPSFEAEVGISSNGKSAVLYNRCVFQYLSKTSWVMRLFNDSDNKASPVTINSNELDCLYSDLVLFFFFPFSERHKSFELFEMYNNTGAQYSISPKEPDCATLSIIWSDYKSDYTCSLSQSPFLPSKAVWRERVYSGYSLLKSISYEYDGGPCSKPGRIVPNLGHILYPGDHAYNLELLRYKVVENISNADQE